MMTLNDLTLLETTDSYTVYELTFDNKGKRIYGKLYYPADYKQNITVIASHGYGSSMATTTENAQYFASHGCVCYIYDFCGGGVNSHSDGTMLEMSVLTECSDLNVVIDGIKQCDFVDCNHLYLLGRSQGGMVSAMVAAKRNDTKGLILFYPAFVIPDDARARYKTLDDVPQASPIMHGQIGKLYYQDIFDMDVWEEIKGYDNPVFIAHGKQDAIVPVSYACDAAKYYDDVTLLILPNAGHGFNSDEFKYVSDSAYQFIKHCE